MAEHGGVFIAGDADMFTFPHTGPFMTGSLRRRGLGRRARMQGFKLETLEPRRLLAGDMGTDAGAGAGDPWPPGLGYGTVVGTKWEDRNGDGLHGADEPGLPGVVIYSDLNRNGTLDRGEPLTRTSLDDPLTTDINEAGRYRLERLLPGRHVIREIVPTGFVQTFPPRTADDGIVPVPLDPTEFEELGFATFHPEQLQLTLQAGQRTVQTVAMAVNPLCFRPIRVTVAASDPAVVFENLTGTHLNGCGGDVSKFEVAITGDGRSHAFKILFLDADTGGAYGGIPVWLDSGHLSGAHVVWVRADAVVDQIDFGNQRQSAGAIEGHKWLDRDADGQWDEGEPGLGGVRIYLDQNRNGQWDRPEPSTITRTEDPATPESEAGWYTLAGLPPGDYVVREVVPPQMVQTYPGVGAQVLRSDTGEYQPGAAWDLDATDVSAALAEDGSLTAGLELTVVWRDSCGQLEENSAIATVIGQTILIELSGQHVGDACLDVLSPQQQVVKVSGLAAGRYHVVATLHEDLRDAKDVATLAVVGLVELGGPGQHVVTIKEQEVVGDVNFGNRQLPGGGSVHGRKWIDRNGNGVRDDGEPGLPGVVIYLDANLNNQFDRGEPHTVTRRDDPVTDFDEGGLYAIADVLPGFYIVREVEPAGYRQTFPAEFTCKAYFCIGRGHMVTVEAGEAIEGLDFGNQPLLGTAAVQGLKWIDYNGNGQRERNEPPLAGVVIYADLNGNRELDEGEPQTTTMRDNPDTPVNETGLYRLEDIPVGETVIREVVPDGFRQTYPPRETQIVDSVSQDLPAGRALSFEWLEAKATSGTGTRPDLALLFRVVWRDGCGTLLPDLTTAAVSGDRLQVDMYGTHVGQVCTLALKPQTGAALLADVPAGLYMVRAVLHESPRPGEPFQPSLLIEGRLRVGGDGGHRVRLREGQVVDGLFFGNQSLDGTDPAWLARADFDRDGRLTAQDIDLLAAAIRASDPPVAVYDLSGDGVVSADDMDVMVRRVMRTQYGDSNLDRRFDSSDMIRVFQAGKYEAGSSSSAGWEEGDWNGDGRFDSSDMIFAFQQGGYESGSAGATMAPTAAAIDALWAQTSLRRRR